MGTENVIHESCSAIKTNFTSTATNFFVYFEKLVQQSAVACVKGVCRSAYPLTLITVSEETT